MSDKSVREVIGNALADYENHWFDNTDPTSVDRDKADKILAALKEAGYEVVKSEPCVYESRMRVPPGQSFHASGNYQAYTWCRTHGWDCPNSASQQQGTD